MEVIKMLYSGKEVNLDNHLPCSIDYRVQNEIY